MIIEDGDTILGMLDREKIFYILQEGDKFQIGESCDFYYSVILTKEQMKQLAREISDFAENI